MILKPYSTWILAIFLGLSVVRCAPPGGYEATDSGAQNSTTGFANRAGTPYTAGGDARIIEERRKQTPAPSSESKLLAESITNVQVVRVNQAGKIDRFGTQEARGAIVFSGLGRMTFSSRLAGSTGQKIRSAPIKLAPHLILELEFEDDPTKRYSSGVVHLKQLDQRQREKAQADIYLRSYSASVQTTLSTEQDLEPVNQQFVKLLQDRAFAWVSNIVIQNGRSFYEVQLFAAQNLSEKNIGEVAQLAAGRRLFSFAGEALRIGDFGDSPATRLDYGIMTPKSVHMIGDAEDEDQRTFAVVIEGYQGQKSIDLALSIEKPHADIPTPSQLPMKGLSANSYLRVDYNDVSRPGIRKMIDDFEGNYQVVGVQEKIRGFTSDPKRRAHLVNALNNAQPFRPLIQTIFQNYGIAPPAALVTFIESAFFASGNYVLETNPVSTASGPFQLLYGTARRFGMRVFENKEGALPNKADHRLYFVPSACGAAKHLKDSVVSIAKRDSTMAIAAYYLGNAGVAGAIHKVLTGSKAQKKDLLGLIKKYNFLYRDVARQHMLPPHVLDYTNKALALYFVTGNPILHNFAWADEPRSKLPAGKVLPPIGEIKDPICRQSIHDLGAEKLLRP
ncbi:MAG: hypothetical protein AB7K41_09620 [Bdellovibrionales bacterium]